MEWSKTGVIATLLGSLILTSVYFFLYFQEKRKFLLIWTISWFFIFLRDVFILFSLFIGEKPFFTIFFHSTTLISGVLLMWGVYDLVQRRFPPTWLIFSSAGILWTIITVLLQASSLLITLPIYSFLAWIYVWTGRITIISRIGTGRSKYIFGGALIAWGVHNADYPFLRIVEWFAPIGFLLGAMLELITAIGMLILFFEINSNDLRRSERRYKTLFENAGVGVVYLSLDGVIKSINKVAANRHNKSALELIDRNLSELTSEEHYLKLINSGKKSVSLQKTISNELVMNSIKGSRWLKNHYTPIHDRNGKPVGFQIISDDITTRKHAEKAFYESQRRLIETQDIAKIGWWEYDFNENIFEWSEETYLQFGLPMDETIITAEKLFSLIHPDWYGFYSDKDAELKENGNTEYEIPIICPNGEQRWIWIRSELQRDSLGQPIRSFGTSQNITEKKKNTELLEKNYSELRTLHEIDQIIVSSINQQNTLEKILKIVLDGVKLDAAIIYKYHPETYTLEYYESFGLNTSKFHESRIKLGQGILGKVAKDRVLLHFCDIVKNSHNFDQLEAFKAEEFRIYYGVPLISNGELKGVLEIYNRELKTCEEHLFDLIKTISIQVAIAMDNMQLYSSLSKANLDLQMAYETTLEGWAKTLELRDQETEGHSERVTELTIQLARKYGLENEEIVNIRRGAMLHDIGKMGIPDSILHKPGPLSEEEWTIMKQHPQLAFDYLKDIPFLKNALDIPFYHHERWDGKGYPVGLKGNQIPLAARLFAVVDVYEALSSNRPYRDAWPMQKIIDYMKSESGKHFDAQVLKLFWEVIDKHS